MLKFLSFTGINNQRPSAELEPDPKTRATPLLEALNVDITLLGRLRRRAGFARTATGQYRNIFEAPAFTLATKDGDLINSATDDILYETLSGTPRTWYTPLPDGRCTFSNGLICGITDGTIAGTTKWGVPLPSGVGEAVPTAGGSLFPGTYKYALTHVRLSDGLEGGTTVAAPFTLAEGEGTVAWIGLPSPPAGHKTNVYLTSANGDTLYLAATTTDTTAAFSGANKDLQLACKTDNLYPAPAGICTAFWRGRTLIASGNLLIASRSQQWELFDLARDVKAFSADITLVQPVDGGIWVGTEEELVFLRGQKFDDLQAVHGLGGPVMLGSGVTVDARNIKGDGEGPAMVCIVDGYVAAGMPNGTLRVLTDNTYRRTDVDEVVATFRMNGELPQYIAVPQ